MKKKIIGIFVCTLVIASVFGNFSGITEARKADFVDADQLDSLEIINDQYPSSPYTANIFLGGGLVMGNGDCEKGVARATCEDPPNIEGKYPTKITVAIDYDIDCWALWDWGAVEATVNGVKKAVNTESNLHGQFKWDIDCPTKGNTVAVSWHIFCRLTDIACDKQDDCSGSFLIVWGPTNNWLEQEIEVSASQVINKVPMKYDNNPKDEMKSILFSDDFNDGIIDITKWSEYGFQGTVEETGGWLQITVHENDPTNGDGIESIPISAKVTEGQMLSVPLKMKTYFAHYQGFVGVLSCSVYCLSGGSITIEYRRLSNELHVMDSLGGDMVLFTADETSDPWDVEFQIYSNKYQVIVDGESSGWISKSICPSGGSLFKLKLGMHINGDYPDYWWTAGFDDVLVDGLPTSREKIINRSFTQFLQNHPNMFPILQRLLQRLLLQ